MKFEEYLKRERCPECIEKFGQEPSPWGDSMLELNAYDEHASTHRFTKVEFTLDEAVSLLRFALYGKDDDGIRSQESLDAAIDRLGIAVRGPVVDYDDV